MNKPLTFISILCSIFFFFYKKSDEKGSRKWWTSFKIALIFSTIASGLICVNIRAIERTRNNNQAYQERVLQDQEDNYQEDNHQEDNHCLLLENQKSQESKVSEYNNYFSNVPNKKQSAEQYELEENITDRKIKIVSKIKEDAGLVLAAKKACQNSDVQKDINHLEEELAKGNDNPGIGRKPIGNGIIEHLGKNGGRIYIRESDGVIEILAKSGKKKINQHFVINKLKQIYG